MQKFSREFIQKLKEKDSRAIEELYKLTITSLYNYILYKVNGDSSLAEDILSEVYCTAINYLSSLTLTHNVQYWLFRIAKTKIADHFRKLKKENKIVNLRKCLLKAELFKKSKNLSPEITLLNEQSKLLIKTAFQKLPVEYQEILVKKYINEMKADEIAAELKRSVRAVESIVYRGRHLFRKEILKLSKEGNYFNEDEG